MERTRARATAAVIALVVLVGLVPGGAGGPVPAGAAVGDPPTTVDLPISGARSLVVHWTSGRVFVLGDDGVAVRTSGGAAVATVPVTGTAIATEGDDVVVVGGASLTRIDADTLATTTWSLAPRTEATGLVVWLGKAWTTARTAAGTERTLVQVDLATGAATDRLAGLDPGPHLLTGDPNELYVVEVGAAGATATARVMDADADPVDVEATVELPSGPIRDVHAVAYGDQVAVAAGDEIRTYRRPTLASSGTLPVEGGGPVLFGREGIAATSAQQGPGTATVMLTSDLTTARTFGGLGIPTATRGLALSPDNGTLYVVATVGGTGPTRLQILDLEPEVTSVAPRTIGAPGGTIVVRGRGFDEVARTADGRFEIVSRSATEIRLTLDADICCHGPGGWSLALDTPYGARSRPFVPVRQVRMGPYLDGYDLADGLQRDVRGRAATTGEREAVDAALLATGEPGPLWADLSRDPAARGPRAAVARLYLAAFNRMPDHDGLEYWAAAIAGGRDIWWVTRAVAVSPEFRSLYTGIPDDRFVRRVYGHVLQRVPSPADQAYWEAQLRRGTSRAKVVHFFAQSPENQARRASDVDVGLLYHWMLRRNPTTFELSNQGVRIRSGTPLATLADEILDSNEYGALHVP